MEPVSPPPIPETNQTPAPPPVELTVGDKRAKQMDKFLQTGGSVLGKIVGGIGRVVQEVADLILRR